MPSRLLLLLILFGLTSAGCSGVRLMEDREDYARDIERLQRRLLERPGDARALRDLGIIYVRTSEYAKGQEYLQRAFAREPDDPATLFHLGLSSEVMARRETALRFYEKYADVPRRSPYRRLMQGRYSRLVQANVRDEARRLAATDAEVADVAPTSPHIVAVFPLSYEGGDAQYAPLGRGLAEMVTADLAAIRSVRVVERVRLQALLDELALGQSGRVDPSSAPRAGRLLGAGRVVGGTYSVVGGEDLHLGAAVAQPDGATSGEVSAAGQLDDLFRLEKALVLDLIRTMGLDLTPEERDALEQVPTRNLQAFLLYSRGLEREDAGDYGEAANLYGRAARIDPSFSNAVDAAERAESAESVASAEDALAAAVAAEGPRGGVSAVDGRVQQLNESLGSHVIPGPEMRSPAQEALQDLPTPPQPPD